MNYNRNEATTNERELRNQEVILVSESSERITKKKTTTKESTLLCKKRENRKEAKQDSLQEILGNRETKAKSLRKQKAKNVNEGCRHVFAFTAHAMTIHHQQHIFILTNATLSSTK